MAPSRPRRSVRETYLATRPADMATETPVAADTPATRDGSKFTVILSAEDAATFDQLALDVRRLLGRRVVKGDLVRALVALAADDSTLRDQVIRELRAKIRV